MTVITTSNQAVDQEKFNDNFDRIFGKPKPVQAGHYVLDEDTGKCVPRETYTPKAKDGVNAPMVMKPMEAFISPIDQTRIGNREQLAAHNTKHGVTNIQDYNNGYIERKAEKRVKEGQEYLTKTRRLDLIDAFNQHQH